MRFPKRSSRGSTAPAPAPAPTATAALVLATLTALAKAQGDVNRTCADGVHMIVARGSDEMPGTGILGDVVNGVQEAIQSSEVEPLDYPATLANYQSSYDAGVEALQMQLTEYTEACPDSDVVLMGYSQGAQVIIDALCGRSGDDTETTLFDFDTLSPIDSSIINQNVIAVVLFGDPTHVPDHPWNAGNATREGIVALHDITSCRDYAPLIRSWCDDGDGFCDFGGLDPEVHLSYVQVYGDDAVEFVTERVEEAGSEGDDNGDDDEASPTSSAAPSGTPAPADEAAEGDEGDGDDESAAVAVKGASWAAVAAIALSAGLGLWVM